MSHTCRGTLDAVACSNALDNDEPSQPSMTSLLCSSISDRLLHRTRNKIAQAYHSTPRTCSSPNAPQSTSFLSDPFLNLFTTLSAPARTLNSPNGRRCFDGRAELAEHVIGACTRSGLAPAVRPADLLASTNTSRTPSSLCRLPLRSLAYSGL
ncbi:hypothetical protein KVT40_009115 [Elsinoe batatas]|uniref:Uncharacterized protein n=1 Tax=Elsinoe batatas TaxID=2601811 RepID=A0A8K0KUI1_9PEZI|nr:hypothetical protein KVT40_009115 [Elsinoe batatas]